MESAQHREQRRALGHHVRRLCYGSLGLGEHKIFLFFTALENDFSCGE